MVQQSLSSDNHILETHSRLVTWLVTKLTRRVPPVEQELLTLPEHLSSPPVFSDIMFCRPLFVLLYFFFWPLCCLFFSSIYGFWLPPFSIFKLFLYHLSVYYFRITVYVHIYNYLNRRNSCFSHLYVLLFNFYTKIWLSDP